MESHGVSATLRAGLMLRRGWPTQNELCGVFVDFLLHFSLFNYSKIVFCLTWVHVPGLLLFLKDPIVYLVISVHVGLYD